MLDEARKENLKMTTYSTRVRREVKVKKKSEERCTNVENLKYEVVLKVLALAGAPERVRMTFVLKTTLTLKMEEIDKIDELEKNRFYCDDDKRKDEPIMIML